MNTVEQDTFEPTREQMAHVERLAIEHAPRSVEVKLDPKARTLRATIRDGASFVFDENGDEVHADPPTTASIDVPLDLVRRLIGDGPVALAVEGVGHSTSAVYDTRPYRLGDVIEAEVVAAVERLLATAGVGA